MRKTFVLAGLMLTLLTLTALMPVVKAATTYYWDGIRFVDIKYPHPDRDYYGISPYSGWSARGYDLYHNQIDQATSLALELTAIGLGATIGVVVGAIIPQPYGAVIGGLVGTILAGYITYVTEVYLFDEVDCIWWWLSNWFVDWLIANLSWLGPLCVSNPAVGYSEILIAFVSYGYLRVGSVTFHDALGIGNPCYNLTISAGSGGTTSPSSGTYEYPKGTSVTVTASAYSDYTVDYWRLDGAKVYDNPITVTMNSDHTLKAYFSWSGGAGGCPILSVFDGSEYVVEGLLDIYNPDGIDVIRNHTLTTTPQPVNNAYLLRLTEHPQTHSYIDQVELFATLEDGTTINLPLTSAVHSEHGNVLPQLLSSDNSRTDTDANQTIDLKFAAVPPNAEVAEFVFQIEGHNQEMKE